MNAASPPLLSIEQLSVSIATRDGMVRALEKVSLDIPRGKTVGLVGESGSGKSVLCRTILRILPGSNIKLAGNIWFDRRNLVELGEREMRAIRGRRISMIFQDPMTSLNPVRTIGDQVVESLRIHLGLGKAAARDRAGELLGAMGIPDPEAQLDRYPGHLSGGMRQRVAIAIALACEPDLLIADEPTTALDVTIQAQILDLLRAEQARRGMSILLVTHDLGVVARYADEVAVLYAGRMLERLPDPALLRRSTMPYTAALVRAQPQLTAPAHTRLAAIPGLPPRLTNLPSGCRFAPRCGRAGERCRSEEPILVAGAIDGHGFACWDPHPENFFV